MIDAETLINSFSSLAFTNKFFISEIQQLIPINGFHPSQMSSIFRLYTQLFPSKPTVTEENLPDQVDNIFIITRSNTGIGFELVNILYSKGAKSIHARTTEGKAEQAIKIITSTPSATSGEVKYLHLDLADLTTVKDRLRRSLPKNQSLMS